MPFHHSADVTAVISKITNHVPSRVLLENLKQLKKQFKFMPVDGSTFIENKELLFPIIFRNVNLGWEDRLAACTAALKDYYYSVPQTQLMKIQEENISRAEVEKRKVSQKSDLNLSQYITTTLYYGRDI
jgi:hypothetical protein